jgi:hypothetical protein
VNAKRNQEAMSDWQQRPIDGYMSLAVSSLLKGDEYRDVSLINGQRVLNKSQKS